MSDVTGSLNGQPIELNNAATEATLRQVLASLKTLNQSVVQLNTGSISGSSGSNAGAALQAVATSGGLVSGIFKGLLGAFGAGISVIQGFLSSFAPAVGSLMNFAGDLIQGSGSLSGFYGALTALPGPLGAVAGLFQKIAQLQEQELDTYRTLTQAGVNFGGSLTDIRQSALGLGMSLEDFGKFVSNNTRALQMMGGSTNAGAEAFVRLGKEMRTSGVGQGLLAMGFSFEQINSGMANYIAMSGGRTAEEMKNTKGLTASASEYMKQLDMLSQITGQSREELEKQQQEQSKNAAWQSYLQTLDEKGREKAVASLNAALAKGGKGAADALQSKLLGLPPLTQEAQMFVAMAGRGADALDGYVDVVKDSSKTIKDVDVNTGKLTVGLAKRGQEMGQQLGGALIAQGGAVGQFASLSIAAANELKNKGIDTEEKYAAYMAKIRGEQDARERSAAAQAAESANAFKSAGDAIYGMLAPAITAITPVINDLATTFMGFITDNMEAVKKALTTFVEMASNFAKDLFSPAGRDKILNDLKYYFGLIMIEVKKSIMPFYDEEDAAEDRAKLDAEKAKFDKNAEVARVEMSKKKEAAVPVPAAEKKTEVQTLSNAVPLTSKNTAKPPNPQPAVAEAATKTESKNIKESTVSTSTNPVESTSVTPRSPAPESIVSQLTTLNKQTEEMIRVLKDTGENIKRNVDATRSLNRNLYPT
jgi:hypothetical protein